VSSSVNPFNFQQKHTTKTSLEKFDFRFLVVLVHSRRNEMNVISQVEKQKCGDCFAVAVVEAIESMYAIKTGKLMNLSVEQMDDCNNFNMGCNNGGNPSALLHWLLKANDGRIVTSEKFTESNNSCNAVATLDDESSTFVEVKDYSYNE
jgi:hypothetical protein